MKQNKLLLILAFTVVFQSAPVNGDATTAAVWIQSKFKFDGFKGFGKSEGKVRSVYLADRMKSENESKFTGKVLGTLTGTHVTNDIYRLDKKISWSWRDSKKTYVERPIEVLSLEGLTSGSDKKQEPLVDIKSCKFSAKKSGKNEKIGKFSAEEWNFNGELVTENRETKEKGGMRIVTKAWHASGSQLPPGAKSTFEGYHLKFAKLVGIDPESNTNSQAGLSVAARLAGMDPKKVEKLCGEAKRKLPLKPDGMFVRTDMGWYEITDEKKKKPVKKESPTSDVDVRGGIGGLFGSLAQKEVKKKIEDNQENQEGKPFVHVTDEILSIDVKPAPLSIFEVPPGFEKIKEK